MIRWRNRKTSMRAQSHSDISRDFWQTIRQRRFTRRSRDSMTLRRDSRCSRRLWRRTYADARRTYRKRSISCSLTKTLQMYLVTCRQKGRSRCVLLTMIRSWIISWSTISQERESVWSTLTRLCRDWLWMISEIPSALAQARRQRMSRTWVRCPAAWTCLRSM